MKMVLPGLCALLLCVSSAYAAPTKQKSIPAGCVQEVQKACPDMKGATRHSCRTEKLKQFTPDCQSAIEKWEANVAKKKAAKQKGRSKKKKAA